MQILQWVCYTHQIQKITEARTMLNNRLQGLIELIDCFEDGNKYFWIDKLNTCNANKGFLLSYFNLL